MPSISQKSAIVFIGTYTEHEGSQSKGIYVYRMNLDSGELTFEWEVKGVLNPSFLAVHPKGNYLYSVNEVRSFAGKEGGGVSAFSMDPTSGELNLVNAHSSRGMDPCYISVEQTGRYALVANYTSGNVAMLPIQGDGGLGSATDVDQHFGSSINPKRQDNPYAHCIRPDPTNRFAIATDLGADKLYIYRMDLEKGKLNQHAEVNVQPGAGPRHMIFHPNGRYMYLINELNSTVILYYYDSEAGGLEEVQTISTLPKGFQGENLCADLRISGRYLYASNRKHDSIAWFVIDENTGRLTYESEIPSGGREPRGLTIDPSGRFALAAHERSDNIVIFKVEAETGRLLKTGHEVKISQPVYVQFLDSKS